MQEAVEVRHVHLRPAILRSHPGLLHICLKLPQGPSVLAISIRFRKAFMAAWEHKGDAHRGIDIPPGLLAKHSVVRQPCCPSVHLC